MTFDKRTIRTLLQQEASKRNGRSLISLTDLIFQDARLRNASDIHIDPMRTHINVRLRIDGQLHDTYSLPLDCHAELIARLKILAGLRIDEHVTPQDGRCVLNEDTEEEMAIRISIMPTHFGENAVLRLLVPHSIEASLTELGMTTAQEQHVQTVLSRMNGMVLVSGATGSGKTTTLYSLMHLLSRNTHSLVTIEDPVEYTLPAIPQIQVVPNAGLTFSKGLRALLRQDPDVIMVGEIRDEETAHLAFTAALTGHLVLSTVHASSIHAVHARLQDLGLQESHIDTALTLNLSQRLVRVNCTECRLSLPFTKEEKMLLLRRFDEEHITSSTHTVGMGCGACNGTGFLGRLGVFDIATTHHSKKSLRSKYALLEHICTGAVRFSELLRPTTT
jgi:type IV pilus assembly protein PilB